MPVELNETHDAALSTWVTTSETDSTDFPIQNLPFGRFKLPDDEKSRIGIAIGDYILDLSRASHEQLLQGLTTAVIEACKSEWLNALMGLTHEEIAHLRLKLSRLLRVGAEDIARTKKCLVRRNTVQLLLPADVRNYSDFFTSIHHASNAAAINSPGGRLAPNFHHLPIAYHGRCSTLSVSGTDFQRPLGQSIKPGQSLPSLGPSQALDFECELGMYVGKGT
eukprot:gene10481-12846_t